MGKLLLILFILLNGCIGSAIVKEKESETINGILIKKYKSETGCFGDIIVQEKNKLDTVKGICYCTTKEDSLWDFIKLGDSIVKQKGSLKVEVYRKGIIKELTYPICIQ